MPRLARCDLPGAWFHVMNRGVARRTMFETGRDMAVFLDLVGAACERGELEVHSFALMSTHYHMLVRSPVAGLSAAMRGIQTEYTRWFNRGRRRDGPLVRGRYRAKPIESITYRLIVVGYIDLNPVRANLVERSTDYPHGSARIHAGGRGAGWSWLARDWVEDEVRRAAGIDSYDPARYAEVFGRLPDETHSLVEARWRSRSTHDVLDDMIKASPAGVRAWMRDKARLADGSKPGLPLLTLGLLDRAIADHALDGWEGWPLVRIGLARGTCGLKLDEIVERIGLSLAVVRARLREHGRLLRIDGTYQDRCARVLDRAFDPWRQQHRAWHRTAPYCWLGGEAEHDRDEASITDAVVTLIEQARPPGPHIIHGGI